MLIKYVRSLTGNKRTTKANNQLGIALIFVAGAINAGGFLAVKQYTSHMTGIVSAMADNLALVKFDLVFVGVGGLLSFIAGATSTAVMVNYARRRHMHCKYAFPLLLEALLLICFGILGARLSVVDALFVPLTVVLLCFIMGLQNAVITKLSNAEIRTTHITGIVTDIGIELGKLFYCNSGKFPDQPRIVANRDRLKLFILMVFFFFVGGVTGAFGFKHIGYLSTVPLAVLLIVMAIVPAIDDVVTLVRRLKRAYLIQ
ncbi:MAG: YoaK family protein [Desulfuromonadaceae bacterium]|nr:YoaK family protein [Desulfuromonadaceae bacterium]MDD2848695.1 YoaK family protein [Desulfuromonadaceae bacterium]MDD4130802.1 YoaK family protein [Desulfuromonadaceae bacterium]